MTIFQIFEVAYDEFIENYVATMKWNNYTLEDACVAWNDWFGDDSQDPLVDWAMEHEFEWAFPEMEGLDDGA